LAIFFFLSALAVTAGWNFFPHYFVQMIPVLALLSARGLAWVYNVIKARGSGTGAAILVMVLLLLAFLYGKGHYKFYLEYTGDQASLEENRWTAGTVNTSIFGVARGLGLDLRNITRENESVFVWKFHPEINFYALRRTPAHAPIVALPNLPDLLQVTAEDIEKNKPDYIVLFHVLTPYNVERLNAILKRDYMKIYSINGLVFAEQGVYKKRPDE
jgi:hypothetical protein